MDEAFTQSMTSHSINNSSVLMSSDTSVNSRSVKKTNKSSSTRPTSSKTNNNVPNNFSNSFVGKENIRQSELNIPSKRSAIKGLILLVSTFLYS